MFLPPPPPGPCYDPVHDDDDLNVAALKRLSLKKSASVKGLKLKPAAWVSASKQGGGRTPGSGSTPSSDVSLIDFGEEHPPPTPSPVVEIRTPSLSKLLSEAENLLDGTPPQSPCRSLPRPLHPTPVVDWDARPLPPPPAYDDVAQDEDDMEVRDGARQRRGETLNPCFPARRFAPSIVWSHRARSRVPGGRLWRGTLAFHGGRSEQSWRTTCSSPAGTTRACPTPSPSQQKSSKNCSKNV